MEYKNRIEEITSLVSEKKFADAIAVADTINWRKIHNINDLMAGSEAYEAVGKLEEAFSLLLLAHDRSPIGRTIIFKLGMLCIKMKDLDEAEEYYKDFVQVAPHDSLKYVLKYNISIAKGEDVDSLIKVLEEFKEEDFQEEWAYELAYLYHKTNQADKCIDLCDEIILWFGDGPIVERALELKMLYQPLDKNQEDKYRHLQQKKDGITEITANEPLLSGEIVPHTITIPQVNLSADRFNTVNLQAEIKKNIDEIMKATEAGEVSENIDAIKSLVEEIPYLQVQEETTEEPEQDNFSVNETFQSYLKEGSDGQISLLLPDDSAESEEQIEGQMTIEDVLADWEKTKRAAEQAMEEAKEKELESARSKALREANNVLNRLEGAMGKLDAGMTSSELLREEYLSQPIEETSAETPSVEDDIKEPEQETDDNIATLENESIDWEPHTLNTSEEMDEVDFKEASQMIADVNAILQQEIDRLTMGDEADIDLPEIQLPEEEEMEAAVSESDEEDIVLPEIDIEELLAEETENIEEPEEETQLTEEEALDEEESEDFSEEIPLEEPAAEEDFELPEIELPEDLFTESEELPEIQEVTIEDEPIDIPEVDDSLPTISEAVLEPEELAELVDENVLGNVIKDEIPQLQLDKEDMETFSYFLTIAGMKDSIKQVLTGAASHIENNDFGSGCICIVGEAGSGKTQLATSIIKVLQKKTGKLKGPVGKISGAKLNEKDTQRLYDRIKGGCLIIETAGDISKETAVTLSLLMGNDKSGTIFIIEDTKRGIDRALSKDGSFARRFTERITIPVFSIDELVSFAKTYAYEAGCSLDDMGTLALYNRINLIGRYDHATTVKEVAEIMDEAIEKSSKGGFFNKPKYDKDGFIVLKEKDFEK